MLFLHEFRKILIPQKFGPRIATVVIQVEFSLQSKFLPKTAFQFSANPTFLRPYCCSCSICLLGGCPHRSLFPSCCWDQELRERPRASFSVCCRLPSPHFHSSLWFCSSQCPRPTYYCAWMLRFNLSCEPFCGYRKKSKSWQSRGVLEEVSKFWDSRRKLGK